MSEMCKQIRVGDFLSRIMSVKKKLLQMFKSGDQHAWSPEKECQG